MSSKNKKSFLQISSLNSNKIHSIFSVADKLGNGERLEHIGQLSGHTGALLFFEPSTRTRMSFETASARLGVYPLLLDGKSGSSLEKGESLVDTVLNIDAMNPSYLVIRCGDELDLIDLDKKVNAPILNAGWGKKGHPTQALLDAYTIRKSLGSCEKQRVLIVGDIRHSRVAFSHFELARVLGYEVALCGPHEFLPESHDLMVFGNLDEGLRWATVAMALRVQLERHSQSHSFKDYRSNFGFTKVNLEKFSSNGIILHPGPINQGVEMDSEILIDSRCRVLDQVSNGVVIRQSILYSTLLKGDS